MQPNVHIVQVMLTEIHKKEGYSSERKTIGLQNPTGDIKCSDGNRFIKKTEENNGCRMYPKTP